MLLCFKCLAASNDYEHNLFHLFIFTDLLKVIIESKRINKSIFCFSEDPVQKIIEQMEPPCKIDAKTNGMCGLKQEHDLWLPKLECFLNIYHTLGFVILEYYN